MCGIAGLYSLNGRPLPQDVVTLQIESIRYRGPNQAGAYRSADGRCALGSRRLSIIDVTGGRQPLHNEDDTVHLVYNGETYNHLTLRRRLVELGHRLQSGSDGEVVLHGYEAWGAAPMLQALRGMAALALWDEARGRLLLARDRFGIKPLYYAQWDGCLIFGSEIKTILAYPGFPRRVNLAALEAMLTLGFVPGPETIFSDVYQLPPAHLLWVEAGQLSLERYWELTYAPDPPLGEAEAAEQLLALLDEAVTLRLMSEVPLGSLLSGGLDSGLLAALVQRGLARAVINPTWQPLVGGQQNRLRTISIGFDQTGYDEAPLARTLATAIGSDHHPTSFSSADFAAYPTVMHHLETPQCSATALPIFKLYEACRAAGLTVVLTGEGADELFGGYFWHRGDHLMRPLLPLPAPLRRLLAASPLPISAAARRVLQRGAADPARRYQDWLEVGGGRYRSALFTGAVRQALSPLNPLLANWAEKIAALPAGSAPLHQTLWLESQTRMVDFINAEVDKLSMAHSIEARVPFLDHKLWEFCAGLPARYKLKGCTEKYLLRRAATSLLPADTRRRRKKGLAAPYAAWLAGPTLPDWAEQALTPGTLRSVGLFDPLTVDRLRRAHQAGQPDLGPLLMGVLSSQIWAQIFLS